MNCLGESYWLHGLYAEALELQQTTVDRMKAVIDASHPDYADLFCALDILGVILGAWRRPSESLELHKKVLEARRARLGDVHVDTPTTKSYLAMALLDLGPVKEAEAHINKAGKRSLSETHLGVLMGRGELARIYSRQHRNGEAESLCREKLGLMEQSRGISHPDCVYFLLKLAQLYILKADYASATGYAELGLERAGMWLTMAHPMSAELKRIDPNSSASDVASLTPAAYHAPALTR
ncbi:hypothetical protein CDD83_9844 [Cordyceps sp. RAO-2017]|nr:hypothetical protein CDD83_9844 [Cordyceps sp. RAO-2017]